MSTTIKDCTTCRYQHEEPNHPICSRCLDQYGYEGTWAPKPDPREKRIGGEAPAMAELIGQIARMKTQAEADGQDMGNDLAMDGLIARSRAILARIDG